MTYTNHITLAGYVYKNEDGRFTPAISISYVDDVGRNTTTDDINSAHSFIDEDEAVFHLNDTLMFDMFNIHIMELATELDGWV